MSKNYIKSFDFHRGLQTKSLEDGKSLPDFEVFANLRAEQGAAKARKGMVRVDAATDASKALDFIAASSEYLRGPVDPVAWTLPTKFTVEILLSPDDKTLTNGILTVGHTTPALIIDTSSNKWRVRFWDSAATLTTLTTTADALETTTSLQVVRDGSSLLLRVDNGTETTGTVDASLSSRTPAGNLRVARDDGTGYFDGAVDYVRAFAVARANHNDRLVRFPDPTAEYVLCDYEMRLISTSYVLDRSRHENTLRIEATPTETTMLAHAAAKVDGIYQYRDEDNKRQVVVVAGGQYFHAEV